MVFTTFCAPTHLLSAHQCCPEELTPLHLAFLPQGLAVACRNPLGTQAPLSVREVTSQVQPTTNGEVEAGCSTLSIPQAGGSEGRFPGSLGGLCSTGAPRTSVRLGDELKLSLLWWLFLLPCVALSSLSHLPPGLSFSNNLFLHKPSAQPCSPGCDLLCQSHGAGRGGGVRTLSLC